MFFYDFSSILILFGSKLSILIISLKKKYVRFLMSLSLTLLIFFNLLYQYRLVLILCHEMVINAFVLLDILSDNTKH